MALADQSAAQAKKWAFYTNQSGVRAVLYPDAQGEGPLEFFGVDAATAVAKCSAWDDHRSKTSKNATGLR